MKNSNGDRAQPYETINENPQGKLADLTKEAADLKLELEHAETLASKIKERYNAVTGMILRVLELMDMDSVKAHGFLFYKQNSTSVTIPKTAQDKELLFKFLADKGIFLEIASVNSQTLNSLYKSLAAEAADEGNFDFKIPGVGEPTTYTTLKLRRQ